MKTIIRKIYYRLAAPLKRLIVDELKTTNTAVNEVEASDALHRIDREVKALRKLIEEQDKYIAELRSAGLHGFLSQYETSRTQQPSVVVSVLADVMAGMQPSTASVKYKIDADEIIEWVTLLGERIEQSSFSTHTRRQTEPMNASLLTAEQKDVELLERQLEFNCKNSLDRERVDSLELCRLQNELALEKLRAAGVVAGK